MSNSLIYILLETFIIFPFGLLIVKLIFKNSITFKFIFAILPGIYITAICGFIVGEFGLIYSLWTAPVVIVVFILCFKHVLKIIQNPINDITKKMKNIGEGKLANNFENDKLSNKNDEIGELYNSAKQIDNYLVGIISEIAGTATSVLSAGNQLSSVSQQIAERASEQATTTEEIAASMEQMVTTINLNAEKAEYSGQISSKVAKETENSSDVIQQTIKSVSDIGNKIILISDIADKTDILSINAAIEAARAGESGKGFAVVAQEIRKLADITKTASDGINKISQSGQKISKTAGEKIIKLIPEILKSAELINNVVISSKEQQSNVENINISIQQLTEITNENSASSEEMSASAEQLSAQAEQLKELISVFKVNNFENQENDF